MTYSLIPFYLIHLMDSSEVHLTLDLQCETFKLVVSRDTPSRIPFHVLYTSVFS